MSVLAPGTPAPEFALSRADGESFTQDDLRGARTVVRFSHQADSPGDLPSPDLLREGLQTAFPDA